MAYIPPFQRRGALATTLGILLGLAPRAFGVSFTMIVVSVLLISNLGRLVMSASICRYSWF